MSNIEPVESAITPDEMTLRDVVPYRELSLNVVSVITIVGLLAIFIFCAGAPSIFAYLSMVAVVLATSGASLLVGGLVGFLFGIPRSRQTDQPSGTTNPSGDNSLLYTPNTNLEQISDWLTKILVGVSLTQLPSLMSLLDGVGRVVAGGLVKGGGAKPFAVAIIVYFVVAGMLLGYLWTSLYLGRALTQAQRSLSLKKRLSKLEEQSQADADALRLTDLQLTSETLPSQGDLDRAIAAAAPIVRANVFYRAQTQQTKNWREEVTKPTMERVIPIYRALVKNDAEQQYHHNHALLGYALKDKREPDWNGAKRELSTAIAIRNNAGIDDWYGYECNRAICSIMLNQEFKRGQPSDEATKESIRSDLSKGFEDEWVRAWAAREATILSWLELNHLSVAELDARAQGPAAS